MRRRVNPRLCCGACAAGKGKGGGGGDRYTVIVLYDTLLRYTYTRHAIYNITLILYYILILYEYYDYAADSLCARPHTTHAHQKKNTKLDYIPHTTIHLTRTR